MPRGNRRQPNHLSRETRTVARIDPIPAAPPGSLGVDQDLAGEGGSGSPFVLRVTDVPTLLVDAISG